MKPLFTVHAGEYLVGEYIEQHFKRLNVWIPSRDTGVDLLVSDRENRRTLSLQVKFSKDYLVTDIARPRAPIFLKELRACGWWTIRQGKLDTSAADVWIFVLPGMARHTTDFVIVPTDQYRRRLQSIHGSLKKRIHTYLWVTEHKRCWETRGLKHKYERQIAEGEYRERRRDFTKWLNNWDPVSRLNTQQTQRPVGGKANRPPVRQSPSRQSSIESEGVLSNDSHPNGRAEGP
jgi:hypothetical protein